MRHKIAAVLPLGLLSALILGSGAVHAEEKKVVFVAGTPSHGYGAHEHNAGCLLLSDLLNKHHDGATSEVFRNGWPDDPDALDGADSIVIFADGGGRHPALPHLDQLEAMIDDGIGFVIIHWAFPSGVADDEWVKWLGGNKEPNWSVNPHWIMKDPELGDHPINNGVEPYTINDEWYYHMRFRENMEGITPILSAHPPKETLNRGGTFGSNPHVRAAVLERGEIQHMAWAYERENGGRSFGFTGGHWHWNWGHPMFRRQVLNAIAWTAGADIPEGGIPAGNVTFEDLLENQDYDRPDAFDRERWQGLVEQWNEAFAGH